MSDEEGGIYGTHTQILTALARIEEKIKGLPCVERGASFERLDGRVKLLESDASFARGAAKATHMIVGIVFAVIVSLGGLLLQIWHMVRGL
jgi:hypothetical protein